MKIFITLTAFLLSLVYYPVLSQESRPNIVLIVSDDHGTDALGAYGNHVVKTPNLDAFSESATRFTNAYCTSSSCSPSRSVILSGLHTHQNGMYGLQHSYHHFQSFDAVRSLPVILSENSYRTARIGKFHIAPEDVFRFEVVLSEGAANDPQSLGRSPVRMADLCRPFISEKSSEPFFLYYAVDDPHRSNIFGPDGKISFHTFPEPNSFGNRKEGYPDVREVPYRAEDVLVPAYLPDNTATRKELAQYYQSISRLDQGVGRLIQILKDEGKYDNTLIIYISDNGPAFPGAKTTFYEPGIRLPCIVKSPHHRKKGSVQNGLVSWADITPTILDYAGIDVGDDEFFGRSFRELVEREHVSGWNEVYAAHTTHEITMYYPMRLVREGRYKLIYNIASELPFPFAADLQQSSTWIGVADSPYYGKRRKEDFIHRPKFELYDLEEDPDEVHNLAENAAYGEVMQRLLGKIKAFQAATRDPWLKGD